MLSCLSDIERCPYQEIFPENGQKKIDFKEIFSWFQRNLFTISKKSGWRCLPLSSPECALMKSFQLKMDKIFSWFQGIFFPISKKSFLISKKSGWRCLPLWSPALCSSHDLHHPSPPPSTAYCTSKKSFFRNWRKKCVAKFKDIFLWNLGESLLTM